MRDFTFNTPTKIYFGRDALGKLGQAVRELGCSRALLVTGKGSVKKSGLLERVAAELAGAGVSHTELAGVDPNPRISTVRQGAALCRQHGVDFILAVGGGSAIDCAKGIAAAALYDGDPWDFWIYKSPIERALPLGTVLTLAATGSEMNSGTVITNEMTQQKHGVGSDVLYPRFSILDPTLTFSVPAHQTAAGVADIMAHVVEFYFSHEPQAFLQNRFAEAVLKTCVHYGPVAIGTPDDYEARANLMWAGSMALNGVVKDGLVFDGFNHSTEHAVSALYDLTHGFGLSILMMHWMEYVLGDDTLDKFVEYANHVWGIAGGGMEAARAGIRRTREFFQGLGLPVHFSEVGIDGSRFDEIVTKSMLRGGTLGQFKKLTRQDVRNILEAAL